MQKCAKGRKARGTGGLKWSRSLITAHLAGWEWYSHGRTEATEAREYVETGCDGDGGGAGSRRGSLGPNQRDEPCAVLPARRLRDLKRHRLRPHSNRREHLTPKALRPATTTPQGDTGLWFVPTAEILPAQALVRERVSRQLRSPAGLHGRVELARDVRVWPQGPGRVVRMRGRSCAASTATCGRSSARPTRNAGGLVNEYPFVSGGWSGNQLGDLWLGGKFNLMSEWTQKPVALAVRTMFKMPTATDDDEGRRHGQDGLRCSTSSRARRSTSGSSSPATADSSSAATPTTWTCRTASGGASARVSRPARALRLTAEFHGEAQFDDVVYNGAGLVGEDGSLPPLVSDSDSRDAFHVRSDVAWQRAASLPAPARTGASAWTAAKPRGARVRQRVAATTSDSRRASAITRRARLRAAATAAATAATGTAGRQAGSRARRQGVVRARARLKSAGSRRCPLSSRARSAAR